MNRSFFIAGVQFRPSNKINEVKRLIKLTDNLSLVPEPENKFDPNAVKIEFNNIHLGYVPKKFSAEIAGLIEAEFALSCTVEELNPNGKNWEWCKVVIKNDHINVAGEQLMKTVYCSNCGMPLEVTRKALPKFGTIIDIIPPHICPEEPLELNLKINPVPSFTKVNDGKFVQNLNKSNAPTLPIGSDNLKDRRFETFEEEDEKEKIVKKSTAPNSVLDILKGME